MVRFLLFLRGLGQIVTVKAGEIGIVACGRGNGHIFKRHGHRRCKSICGNDTAVTVYTTHFATDILFTLLLFFVADFLNLVKGKYEKIKDNLPKMKLLLATLNDGRFSQKELLGSKWAFCNSKFDYYYVSKRLKEAFDTIEEFITECGGEKKIGEVNPRILYGIYSAKARCLFALNQLDESVQYSHKILQYDNDPVVQHVTYLRLARLELFYRQKANYPLACKYVIKANNNIQSQEGYLLLSYIHLKQGRKEEAKKYYSLTLQCKRYPLADEKDLVKLKKLLVE